MLDGKLEQFVNSLQLEFLADVRAVSFDGAMAYEQLAGDLFVGHVLCDELEDPPFGGGQIGELLLFLLQR